MIIFVFGLDPEVGCQLSEHVMDVVNIDSDFIKYREFNIHKNKKVKALYKMQCKWYSEMKQNLAYTHNTDRTPTLHVTDVYLFSDLGDDIRVASELVRMEDNSITSVYLDRVKHPVQSIIQNLTGCKHLTSLHIIDPKDREMLPQLVQLQSVVYGFHRNKICSPADTPVVRSVQQLPVLSRIELEWITLIDTVTLPTKLDTVKLFCVYPARFILRTLCQCRQLRCIELYKIDLTDTVVLPPQLQELKAV